METLHQIHVQKEPEATLSVDPKKFILWLFIVSIVMLFASQTSAYLVRRAEGNWLEFEMPVIFWYSTVVLVLSSLSMHWAYYSAKKDNFTNLKIAISVTFVLGLAFLYMQFQGLAGDGRHESVLSLEILPGHFCTYLQDYMPST